MKQKVKRRIISIILAFGLAVSSAATAPVKVFAGTGRAGVMTAPTTVPTTVPNTRTNPCVFNTSDPDIAEWISKMTLNFGSNFNINNSAVVSWIRQFPIQNFSLTRFNISEITPWLRHFPQDNGANPHIIDSQNPVITNRISTLVSRIFGYPSISLDDGRISGWVDAFPNEPDFLVRIINITNREFVGAWISSFPIWICDPVNISANFTSLPSRLNGSRLFSRRRFAAFARRWNDLARSLQNSLDNISVVPDNSTVVSENSKELPDNSTAVSENSKELSDNSTVVSENSKELPDNSTVVSENSKELPDNSTVVSENSKELSDNSTAVSENSKELPGNSTAVSENSKELSDNSTVVSENSKELPGNSTVVFDNRSEDLIYLPSANSSTGLTSFYRRLNYSRLFPHGLTDLTNFLPSNLTNLVFTSFLTTGLTSLLCSDLIGLPSTNISDGLTSFLSTNSSAGFPALPG